MNDSVPSPAARGMPSAQKAGNTRAPPEAVFGSKNGGNSPLGASKHPSENFFAPLSGRPLTGFFGYGILILEIYGYAPTSPFEYDQNPGGTK